MDKEIKEIAERVLAVTKEHMFQHNRDVKRIAQYILGPVEQLTKKLKEANTLRDLSCSGDCMNKCLNYAGCRIDLDHYEEKCKQLQAEVDRLLDLIKDANGDYRLSGRNNG